MTPSFEERIQATRAGSVAWYERARQAVCAEHPDTEEKLLRVPIRLRENRIIAEEYLELVKRE